MKFITILYLALLTLTLPLFCWKPAGKFNLVLAVIYTGPGNIAPIIESSVRANGGVFWFDDRTMYRAYEDSGGQQNLLAYQGAIFVPSSQAEAQAFAKRPECPTGTLPLGGIRGDTIGGQIYCMTPIALAGIRRIQNNAANLDELKNALLNVQ